MTTILGLLIIGTILVFLETILVGGICGIAGVVSYGIATYFSYTDFGSLAAISTIFASLVACILAFVFWLKVLPKTRFGKSFYLNTSQDGKAQSTNLKLLVGKEAIAITEMNPSGKVEVDRVPYDARCETASAKVGDKLSVISANSFELVVRKI